MSLTNNLRKQVDIPVWEWARFAPSVSSALSSTTAADNSTYHVNHGRYVYYFQSSTTAAGGIGIGTGFWRYDTVTDTYMQLAVPPVAPLTFTGMQFVGGHGYYGRVLSANTNSITCAALTGQTLKSYDIRISSGTGMGQHRIITNVSDPIIADSGTFSAVSISPQNTVTDANKNWQINQWVGYQVHFVANTGQTQIRKIIYNSATVLTFADTTKYAEELNAYSPVVTIAGAAIAIAAIGTQYQIESSVITMDSPWTTVPDATSKFLVHSGAIWLLGAGTTSYLLEYYDVAADTWYIRNPASNTSPASTNGTDGTIVNTGEVALIEDRGIASGTQTSTTLQDTTKSWGINSLSSLSYKVRIFSGTGWGQIRSISSNTANTITVSPAWTTNPDTTSQYIIDSLDGGTVTSAGAATQTGVSTGTIQGNIFTAGTTTGAYYAGQILTGTGVQDNTTVISSQFGCHTAGLQTTIIFSYGSTTGIVAGMYVTIIGGAGVLTVGTKVASVTTFTVVLTNAVTTALSGATLQFQDAYVSTNTASSNGVVVTVASTTNLFPGMIITVLAGTGTLSVVGTYITNVVNSTTFHISAIPTVAFSGATLLGTPYQTIISGQLSGIPGGAGTYYVWPPQNVASTTITGTGVATLTDSTKTWPLHRWNGQSIRIVAGTGVGQVRSILGTKCNNTVAYTSAAGATSSGVIITVGSTTSLIVGMMVTVTAGVGSFSWNTTVVSITDTTHFIVSSTPIITLSGGASVISGSNNNTIFIYPNWTTVPDSTSVYVIHGDPDKLYFSMATQTPTFIHNVEADLITTGRMLDYGVMRPGCAQYADQTPVAIPVNGANAVQNVNYIVGTGAAYLSAAGATSSGTLVTVTTTNGLFVGCPVTVSAGIGTFLAGSYVSTINSATTFTVSATPSATLTGGASVVSGVASALVYFGTGPFLTTALSGTGAVATATFTSLPGCAYTGSTTIPVNSLITIMGAIPAGYNGTFVVTASSAGSVSWASAVSGAQTTAGTLSGGAILPLGSYTISGCVPAGYNATVTATSAAAGFLTFANATVGQLTTTGVIAHPAQATTACTIASTTATVTFANGTYFPIGSYVSITNVATATAGTGSYNGVYQVTASSAGSVSYSIPTNTPSGTASVQGNIQLATTTQIVQTVNNHHFKAGQIVTHAGDVQYANANTNISAAVYPVAGTTNQYTYTTSGPASSMVYFSGGNIYLSDVSKNWIPNQWANCLVTYNITPQYAGALTGASTNTAYIIANTSNKLIFAAGLTTPTQGISRYVITLPPTSLMNSMLGSADNGLALGVQLATQTQDQTKYWPFPANISSVAAGATSGASTITVAAATGIYPGMFVAVTTNTAGSLTLPANTTVVSIAGLVVTLSASLSGTTGSTTFTFFATTTSSGTTITIAGYTTQGLQVGMYLGVNSVDNIKNTTTGQVQYNVAGAFVTNGGTVLTTTYVTAILSTTTFTISTSPTVPLVNANIAASFWYTNQWVGRRLRLTTGNGTNYLEQAITSSTATGILTTAAFGSAPVSGVTGYAILQQPSRGLGTSLLWNYGQTDYVRRGSYLLQARGGGSTGFDRLNLTTDTWDFLTPTPNYEVLQTGAMYAYDGGDRIYFTPQITQRVYYLDIDKMSIHGGSQYPYTASAAAIIGNRMEIFSTADGLKYLWLNRHGNQECFKLLLFF